jgi:hypothetical protein
LEKRTVIPQAYRCNPCFHGRPRYDWVAIFNTQVKERSGKISDFSFAQLRLLFQYKHKGDIHNLAYIQHFKVLSRRDQDTGMWILERTELFEVISVNAIIHNVHLIPFFDAMSGKDTLEAKKDVYSFQKYVLNHYSDRYSFSNFF